MYKALFEKIDEKSEEYLDFLEDICNIESKTDDKAGVDAVCDFCVAYAEKKGWAAEIFREEISGNTALISLNANIDSEPLVLSAHMDTVHQRGSFGAPAVRRTEECMYGPGVMDCKGGIAAAFLALDALSYVGFDSRPVKLFLQSDEENSSITSKKATVRRMCELARGAIGFINLEGHVSPTAVITRKGIVRYRFTVHGKAIHSARCAYGANAIAEAAYKILELEKMKDVEGLTCNCGVINGGTTANTVAERCEFTADIRFANPEELEQARAVVERLAAESVIDGCTTEALEISYRPAMPASDTNLGFLEKINEIYQKCALPTLEPRFCVSGSDAAYITECGIPCIDSVGTEGGNIHSVREFIYNRSLAEAAKRIASVAMYI